MISKRTLFIVGAGASVPYGLPTGQGLRSLLCRELQYQTPTVQLLVKCGFSESDLKSFAHKFLYSGQASIDAFLARREEYRDIGLHAIAATLLPLERLNLLYTLAQSPDDPNSAPKLWGFSDWLGYVWGRMCDGALEPEHINRNAVSFITFNYDRSIEAFFLSSIQHTFGVEIDVAHSIVSKIPIFHMYGDLGPYSPNVGFRYGEVTAEAIKVAATRLHVMPSTRPERETSCDTVITFAKQTIFLGFGFDSMNCHRLGFQSIRSEDGSGGPVIGTAFQMSDAERSMATNRVATKGADVLLRNMSCLELLREHAGWLH